MVSVNSDRFENGLHSHLVYCVLANSLLWEFYRKIMKWFVCFTLLAIALSGCTAEQSPEFRERAEIYSSNVPNRNSNQCR